MKRLLLLIPIIALLLLPIGCVDVEAIEQDVIDNIFQQSMGNYTIKVSGTVGLYFTGEYTGIIYDVDPDTYVIDYTFNEFPVEGQVPEEYTFEAMAAAVFFQKQTGDETLLRVELWKDGVLQDSASTTNPWGAVFVAGGP